MKILKAIFVFVLSLFIFAPFVFATDITVTCDGVSCSMFPAAGAALFNEPDIKPGYNIPRYITVINNSETEDCVLIMGTKNEVDPDNLTPVLFTVIDDGTTSFFGNKVGGWQAGSSKSLWDLFSGGDINLGTIAAGDSVNYLWAVTMDPNAGNEYQGITASFDFDLNFSCGESQTETPNLIIDKTNDKKGTVLHANDVVNYTITIKNTGLATALGVQVKDVQPTTDYFEYDKTSGYLTCSGGTDTSLTASGFNPYYWSIGNLDPAEECTLTYKMTILNDSIPGEHNNIAVAYGQDSGGTVYYSNVVKDPLQIGVNIKPSSSYSGEVLGAAISKVGEVLGAATGSPTFWLILSLLFIVLGSVLKLISRKKTVKYLKTLFLALSLSGLMLTGLAKTVLAADIQAPEIAIVKLPEYLNKTDLEISYTALDGGEAGLKSVHLEYKKEGGSYQDLGTYSDGAKKIAVNSSKINSEAKYYFKATACDNNNNCAEDETFTNIDTSAPPKPENYSKEKIGVQSYKIKWHNPDSDDLDKVYVYRDENKDYIADDSHKVAEVSVVKNTDKSWTDAVIPDSSKEYYYAISSVDKAGNASELVGDTYTIYKTTQEVGVISGETVTGPTTIPDQKSTDKISKITGKVLGEEMAVATSEAETEKKDEDEKEPLKENVEQEAEKLPWFLLAGGGIALIGFGYWWLSKVKN